jgi:hypothetical protein
VHALRGYTENVNKLSFYKGKLGDRRCAGASMRAQRFKFDRFFVCAHKPGDRKRRQQRHLHHRQRNRNVADVADLAVLLV